MTTIAYILKNFKFEENPWIQAVKTGDLDLVKILYENEVPGYNERVIEESIEFSDIFKYLLQKYPTEKYYSDRIVSHAIYSGDDELVKWSEEYFHFKYTKPSRRVQYINGKFLISNLMTKKATI